MRDRPAPHGFRPPWWPEGEPFPPTRGGWHATRGHFLRRIGLLLLGLFLFVFLTGWIGAVLFGGAWDRHDGRGFFPGGLFVIVLLIAGFMAFGRAIRRTARPIGDVMEAAGRVAAGDYSARARVQGPPEVRELARAFNEMAGRIEANEGRRRNLLADVTHELRTPLAVIRGRLEGMLDGLYEADPEHLASVVEQTQVMGRLLDDLQLLSRAEAGALQLHRERLPPAELVEAAVGAHRGQAAEVGIDLVAEVADGLPELDVDRVRIGEVLSNLLTNALRYTPRGGTITVAVEPEAGQVAFRVADTGTGIPADRLAHVFDRFTKSGESRGSGLGLAIAKSLVVAHGGTISAASEPGGGTTIRFRLPAA